MIERAWSPWKELRPSIAARVIAKDGTVHELDPKTIAESPMRNSNDDVLTDCRVLKAPLPAIEPDSIFEEQVISKQTALSLASETIDSFYFGNSVPVQRTLVTIRFPEVIPFRFKKLLLPYVAVSDRTIEATREIRFDQGPMNPLEDALRANMSGTFPAVQNREQGGKEMNHDRWSKTHCFTRSGSKAKGETALSLRPIKRFLLRRMPPRVPARSVNCCVAKASTLPR